jgi:hypothetical protein
MMMKGPVRELIPIGEQRVRVRIPGGDTAGRVRLLVGDATPRVERSSGELEVIVPRIVDHEVVAIDLA